MAINTNGDCTTPVKHILNHQYIDFKEKRCQQLQKLSQEHNDCILFAEKIAAIAETGNELQLSEGIKLVREYNLIELEAHLQHEEQTIFALLVQQYKEHLELCITLGREHGFIRTLVEQMSFETAQQDLSDFANLLKHHTLEEETKLFPIVESLFSEEQLNEVLSFKPVKVL